MSNKILSFPVLGPTSAAFDDSVSYVVEASRSGQTLTIKHILKGESYVSKLIKSKKAQFSVRLFYEESSQREHHLAKNESNSEITCKQEIEMGFSYPPVIVPNIISLEDVKSISPDKSSGLQDAFRNGKEFNIPGYARIAEYNRLSFMSGDFSQLISVQHKEELDKEYPGSMETQVDDRKGAGETPITLFCSNKVYIELKNITSANAPSSDEESLRLAVITQALCATYAYMHNAYYEKSDEGLNANLKMHMEQLKDIAKQDWLSENFNPSLAATIMQRYYFLGTDGRNDD